MLLLLLLLLFVFKENDVDHEAVQGVGSPSRVRRP